MNDSSDIFSKGWVYWDMYIDLPLAFTRGTYSLLEHTRTRNNVLMAKNSNQTVLYHIDLDGSSELLHTWHKWTLLSKNLTLNTSEGIIQIGGTSL